MRSACSRSRPSNTSTVASTGRPSLRVPVLSNTMSVARARLSSASGRSASRPILASAPCAAASAAGTASDSAQGQLITSRARVTSSARAGSCCHHQANTAAATGSSTSTKRLPMRSALRASAGRWDWACSTSRASCEMRVAVPVQVTCSRAGRSRQTVPA